MVFQEVSARQQGYRAVAAGLREQLLALPPGTPPRLGKRTSNLFRARQPAQGTLDVSGLSGVLSVDPHARTADVLGLTTYEDLVAATLPHGLAPCVVPQLRTITLGGAVGGLGVESSSFREGLPHESVLEMDVLTGDGRLLTARPDGEHAALYRGFPGSYGTLGYALRLRIRLMPVLPYVALRHLRFDDPEALFTETEQVCERGAYAGEQVDFVDATLFSPTEAYLTLGRMTDSPANPPSDYTGTGIYYRSIPARHEDVLTVHDYLWRWDTDWFWCSRAFGAQHPVVRRLWPRRLRRSDTYWHLVRWDQRTGFSARLTRLRGQPPGDRVVHDVQVPVERAAELARWLDRTLGMRPVWACPLRLRPPGTRWPLYPLEPGRLYVNLGFWGTVALPPGAGDGHYTRLVEQEVGRLGGRTCLYSTATYPEEEFRAIYGGEDYAALRAAYDPQGRLLDLYDKCVRRA